MSCYYPGGQLAPNLSPCNRTAEVSHCCRDGVNTDICLTNGLCYSTGLSAVVRRGCTDPTFNSTNCPQQCTAEPGFRSGDVVLSPCQESFTFCCGLNDESRQCCSTGNGTVRIPAGNFMPGNGAGGAIATSIILSTTTITSSISLASGTTCPSAVSATSTNGPSSTKSCEAPRDAAIGVGVALLISLIAACYFFWKWRDVHDRKIELENTEMELENRKTGLENRNRELENRLQDYEQRDADMGR